MEIRELIEQFNTWTGKGNLIQANNTASQIFSLLADQIEKAEVEPDPSLVRLQTAAALERNDTKTLETLAAAKPKNRDGKKILTEEAPKVEEAEAAVEEATKGDDQ